MATTKQKTNISKRLATVIRDTFPKDIAAKIRAAIMGGEWSDEPQCFNDWSTAAVEDHGWTCYLHELGFHVENGVLYCDLWSTPSGDNDWDIADSVDMASEEYNGWVDRIVAEDEASWVEYAKYVAETGKDPLDNYIIGLHTKKVKWQFVIAERGGLAVEKVRRLRGNWITLAKAPQVVRDYFQPDDLKEFSSLADIKAIDGKASGIRWMRDPDKFSIMGVIELDEALPDALIRRKLIAVAKKHVREKK